MICCGKRGNSLRKRENNNKKDLYPSQFLDMKLSKETKSAMVILNKVSEAYGKVYSFRARNIGRGKEDSMDVRNLRLMPWNLLKAKQLNLSWNHLNFWRKELKPAKDLTWTNWWILRFIRKKTENKNKGRKKKGGRIILKSNKNLSYQICSNSQESTEKWVKLQAVVHWAGWIKGEPKKWLNRNYLSQYSNIKGMKS